MDTVRFSHPVLFPGYLRQLLALEMKDACLAAFKDLHNSECHLYCKAVFTPFHAQYGGDDQKDLNQGRSSNMSALQEATMPTLRPTWGAFMDCSLVNSTEETYLYLSIWKRPSSWKTNLFQKAAFKFSARNPWGFSFFFETKLIRLSASKRYSIINGFNSISR